MISKNRDLAYVFSVKRRDTAVNSYKKSQVGLKRV